MDSNLLIYVAIGIVVLGIAVFLLQSLVKAAIITVVVLVLFRIGWVYTTDEFIGGLRLDKFLHPERVEELRIGYEDYVHRRDEDPIVVGEAVEETMRSELRQKVDEYLKKLRGEAEN